jgi:hypothetical protein
VSNQDPEVGVERKLESIQGGVVFSSDGTASATGFGMLGFITKLRVQLVQFHRAELMTDHFQ